MVGEVLDVRVVRAVQKPFDEAGHHQLLSTACVLHRSLGRASAEEIANAPWSLVGVRLTLVLGGRRERRHAVSRPSAKRGGRRSR